MLWWFGGWTIPLFIAFIAVVVLSIYAQIKVSSTYKRYLAIPNRKGITGYEMAENLKREFQMDDLSIERINGELTDHYNPRNKKLALSANVADKASIASVAIAAHEMGHARQHAEKNLLLRFRDATFPVLKFSSQAAIPLLIFGFIFSNNNIVLAGIILYSVIAIFQVITVPIELNASSRALMMLKGGSYLSEEELKGAKKVLSAAALTYIAAIATVLVQLLRFIFIFLGSRD